MTDEWTRRATDPAGRDVVFDVGSHMHLVRRGRGWLIGAVDEVLRAVERPDHHERDPIAGRERFYRRDFPLPGQWLRVIVDFNEQPAWIVTALQQDNDPRLESR